MVLPNSPAEGKTTLFYYLFTCTVHVHVPHICVGALSDLRAVKKLHFGIHLQPSASFALLFGPGYYYWYCCSTTCHVYINCTGSKICNFILIFSICSIPPPTASSLSSIYFLLNISNTMSRSSSNNEAARRIDVFVWLNKTGDVGCLCLPMWGCLTSVK